MLGLTVRRSSASLLATATRQAGGGGRLIGLGGGRESPANMGASGVRSPLRSVFSAFFLPSPSGATILPSPSGATRGFCSGVPRKTDRVKMAEKIQLTTSSISQIHEMLLKQRNSGFGWTAKAVGVILIFYVLLQLGVALKAILAERITHFAENKIRELSRDEEVLRYVDIVAKRAEDTFMRRINHLSPVKEWWKDGGIATAAHTLEMESEWVRNAFDLACLLQEMSKRGMELKKDFVIQMAIGFLGYKQDYINDLLAALILTRTVKDKRDDKTLNMSKSIANADLGSDQNFINKLKEAEKPKK